MTMTLEEVLKHAESYAVAMFDPTDETMPSFLAFDAEDKMYCFMTPFEQHGDDGGELTKRLVLLMLRQKFKEDKIVAYAFISEAWIVKNDRFTDPAVAKLQPRQRSDRSEVLHVMACNAEEARHVTFDIDRVNKPHLIRREGWQKIGGRMASLLMEAEDGSADALLTRLMRENREEKEAMARTEGMRVHAAISVDNVAKVVQYLGAGVYEGDKTDNQIGIPNPKIKLDDGRVVWGYECWWGEASEWERKYPRDVYKYENVKLEREKAN